MRRFSLVRAQRSLPLSFVFSAASLTSLRPLSNNSLALSTAALSILIGLSSAIAGDAKKKVARASKSRVGFIRTWAGRVLAPGSYAQSVPAHTPKFQLSAPLFPLARLGHHQTSDAQ